MARREGADSQESSPIVSDVATDHQAADECQTRAERRGGATQFAKAIARSEFGRFYRDGKAAELTATAGKRVGQSRKPDKVKRG
jgi:hypothetical protein